MKKLLAVLSLTSALVGSTAIADAGMNNADSFYVKVGAGFASGKSIKFTGNEVAVKDKKHKVGSGVSIHAGAGYKFNENLRADLVFNYRPNNKVKLHNDTKAVYHRDLKASSMGVTANLYYDVMTFNGFTPYVTAGVGFAKNKIAKINHDNGLTETNKVVTSLKSKGQGQLTWNAGVGFTVNITEDSKIDAGYRFVGLGKFKVEDLVTTTGTTTPVNATIVKAHKTKSINVHEFVLSFIQHV